MSHLWTILLVCCCFGAVLSDKKALWKRRYVLDRSAPNYISPGYYILPIDRTTFSVSHPVYLDQFDVSRIFLYDPTEEVYVNRVPVQFKFVEIYRSNFHDKATLLAGRMLLNSTYDSSFKFSSDLKLDPSFLYEIRLEMPSNMNLMYNEYLKVREFTIKRPFGRSVEINLYQYNSDVKPPNVTDTRRKVSQGMVKRLHFKYPIV